MAPVEGFAAAGFEAVRETFQSFMDDGRESGAGVSVWRDGQEVVQLCAGFADAERRRPWGPDTLVQPYSLSKPFAAFAALVAVKDGALELDEPIAKYWPSYGQHGKDRTTLRQILTHQAGQPRFPDNGVDLLDEAALRESLAAAPPEYEPGTSLGEHSLTYGHLIDGVLRAGAGTTLGEVFNDVVRPALGLDAWFGVPDSELHRVADLEYGNPDVPRLLHMRRWVEVPDGILDVARMNSRPWRQAVFGSVNLHLNASSAAKFFADLNDPDGQARHLLGPDLLAEFLAPQVRRHDEVFETTLTWTLGLIRDEVKIAKGGLGGSAAWWSLKNGHACAFLTRRLEDMSRVAQLAAAANDDLSLDARLR
jgi:CubicO group peptidase (beta-lactamase class C family)